MPQETDRGQPAQNALIALGSNLEVADKAPPHLIFSAIRAIEASFGNVAEVSRFYRTPAFPAGAGPDFVNAAIRLTTKLPEREILDRLHEIELDHGRVRDRRWGARTLDLDLIGLSDRISPGPEVWHYWATLPVARQVTEVPRTLILPHPRMQDRAFVLVPLRDVAADWRHPVLGKTVAELCEALPQAARDEITLLPMTSDRH